MNKTKHIPPYHNWTEVDDEGYVIDSGYYTGDTDMDSTYRITFPTAEELSELHRYESWKQALEEAMDALPYEEAPVSHPVNPLQSIEIYNTETGQTFEVTEARQLQGWANLWVVYYMVGGIEHATRFDYSTGRAYNDMDSPYVCRNVKEKEGSVVPVRVPLWILNLLYTEPYAGKELCQEIWYTRYD